MINLTEYSNGSNFSLYPFKGCDFHDFRLRDVIFTVYEFQPWFSLKYFSFGYSTAARTLCPVFTPTSHWWPSLHTPSLHTHTHISHCPLTPTFTQTFPQKRWRAHTMYLSLVVLTYRTTHIIAPLQKLHHLPHRRLLPISSWPTDLVSNVKDPYRRHCFRSSPLPPLSASHRGWGDLFEPSPAGRHRGRRNNDAHRDVEEDADDEGMFLRWEFCGRGGMVMEWVGDFGIINQSPFFHIIKPWLGNLWIGKYLTIYLKLGISPITRRIRINGECHRTIFINGCSG